MNPPVASIAEATTFRTTNSRASKYLPSNRPCDESVVSLLGSVSWPLFGESIHYLEHWLQILNIDLI
jgi:hypothetical protein